MTSLKESTFFKSSISEKNGIIITKLQTRSPLDFFVDTIGYKDAVILAYKSYEKSSTYNIRYALISAAGQLRGEYLESEGIMPKLFSGPEDDIWVALTPYDPDKEMEIFLPLFQRDDFIPLKPSRPFLGDYVGCSNEMPVFYDVDLWSETKPDKMLALEFKNGRINKKHSSKITPRDNIICIENNRIYLLAYESDSWLLRKVDVKGKELQKKKLNVGEDRIRTAFKLSFEENSLLLKEKENGDIILINVYPDGGASKKVLINIGEEFNNTWPPVNIVKDSWVMKFNTISGNGWLTIRGDELAEL